MKHKNPVTITTIPILCWNGKLSGANKYIPKERNSEAIAATKTERLVAFFQNRATKNITNIPGVKKPVKF